MAASAPAPPLRVAVGSLSPIKLAAVAQVFRQQFPDRAVDVQGRDTQSGVNAQPVGHEETLHGCANRLEQALSACQDAHYVVAMENGLVPVDVPGCPLSCDPEADPNPRHFDVAWVAIYDAPHQRCEWSHSAGVPFPPSAVDEARARGLERTTAGLVLQRQGLAAHHADPHTTLTEGLAARGDLLEQALRVALGLLLHQRHGPG
eukprot:GGOE01018879.1.p2 GENE.GGOE01018879.1~~GGOE01018879.1.p2  ORF type:complete len:211 (-),score=51.94 GGOE01018879.1:409-1020(-)